MAEHVVLPRPGSTFESRDPIPGPTEQEFTSVFGHLLPSARFLSTPEGKAAYYLFPPSSAPSTATSAGNAPTKVLLIHGIQTPALGMLPLTNALRAQFAVAEFALLDLWGHGLSDTPVLPHFADLFHRLIDAALEALGWKGAKSLGIVGYSLGALLTMGYLTSTLVTQTVAESFVLVAPAGLMKKSWFTSHQLGLMSPDCAEGDEKEAAEFITTTLEGGTLVVPSDWQSRVARGEVVAPAIRGWQLKHHRGHGASVVAIFRDCGALDRSELFVKARETGIPSLVVLGAKDDLSTAQEIEELGFDVRIVPDAEHAVVRDNANEVADHIARFWREL